MNKLPLARNKDIVVQTLGKETLIYDLKTDRAYCLNETSAAVYRACNGETTYDEMRTKTGFPDEIVFLALDELEKENLLEKTEEPYRSPLRELSRREAIRKVGLGTMIALPIISSLLAPTAAMAQSAGGFPPGSRTLGQTCTTSTQCASGAPNCTGGTCCVSTAGNETSGTSRLFFTNGSCPSGNTCQSLAGASCCSGSASEGSCTEIAPGTIQLQCICN